DYLEPRLQGYRLRGGVYQAIRPRAGRLPSQVTGLHLEADDNTLRLWNPETQAWLPTQAELREQAEERAEAAEERAADAQAEVADAQAAAEVAQERAEKAERNAEQIRQR